MFPLIETAAAFAAVMLVVSLFVSALVQAIQSGLGLRAAGLSDMLLTLVHNYGRLHGRDLNEAEEREFVDAILTHPLLHTRRGRRPGAAKVARPIEYLDRDDLIDLVKAEMKRTTKSGRAVQKAVHDVDDFTAFVERWYETVGATASQYFKHRMRQLTLLVSCLVVVIFNFDGVHLITDLHRDEAHRAAIAQEIKAIQESSIRLGARRGEGGEVPLLASTDPEIERLKGAMDRTSKILEASSVGVGWQSSFIAERWSAHRERIAKNPALPPDGEMMGDVVLWLMGLLFSCVMLSLGAPFWATTLGSLVNLTNAVQKAKSSPGGDAAKSPEKARGKDGSPDSDRSPG
jgi:hypothetical protein